MKWVQSRGMAELKNQRSNRLKDTQAKRNIGEKYKQKEIPVERHTSWKKYMYLQIR